ncbi:hypothetical protein POTOM_001313 [Populus tomentosa]|uniref:Uncharacterized protein n=1 Tax=Populus tomentosa TaxID=118781 RepID=A0A8X8DHP6_POPTO|nr:hypothetical protein POTOM_001313 [Populus tomentosa]
MLDSRLMLFRGQGVIPSATMWHVSWEEKTMGKIADTIGRYHSKLARSHSLDDKYYSPFARAAALAEESHTEGGRDDDITVVAGMINSV